MSTSLHNVPMKKKKGEPRWTNPTTGKRRTGTDLRKKILRENYQRDKWLQEIWAPENARYAGRWVAIENPHMMVREEGTWLAIGLCNESFRLKKRQDLKSWSRVLMVAEVGENFVVSWNEWDEEMRHDFLQMCFDPALSASRPDMRAFISDRAMTLATTVLPAVEETFVSAIMPWGAKHYVPHGPHRLVFNNTVTPPLPPPPPAPTLVDPDVDELPPPNQDPLLPLQVDILNESKLCPECGDYLLRSLTISSDFCTAVKERWQCISCDLITLSSDYHFLSDE